MYLCCSHCTHDPFQPGGGHLLPCKECQVDPPDIDRLKNWQPEKKEE